MDQKKNELSKTNSNLLKKDISPQSDLANCSFVGQELFGLNAIQSLFTGAFFRETKITDCNFSRCDFEGAHFEVIVFKNVSFKSDDIRSCKFVNSQFMNCDFSDAFIKNCMFIKCNFIDCGFDGSAFTESEINDSRIERCTLTKSTNMLNKFSRCEFTQIQFGDCTFLLHIFDDCQLENVTFNSDSIGLIYGLSVSDLESCELLFLGKEQPSISNSDSIENVIIAEYDRRHWALHSAVSKLNFNIYNPLNFIKDIANYLSCKMQSNEIIVMDDALFVNNIFSLLYDKDMLPYWGLQYLFQNVGPTLKALPKQDNLNYATGNRLLNMSYILFLNLQGRSKEFLSIPNSIELNQRVVCKLKMEIPPEFDICTLMDEAAFAITKTKMKSKILKTQKGSILYWISTSVGAVFGLKLILFGLNGCIVQLTELFSRIKVLSSGETQVYNTMALSPDQRIPDDIALALNSVYVNLMKQNVADSNNLNGLTNKNIVSVETTESLK